MTEQTTVIPQAIAVDNVTLQNSSGTLSVKALGIDTAQLAANAVTSAKITDGTIAAGDLGSGSVTPVKIGGGTNEEFFAPCMRARVAAGTFAGPVVGTGFIGNVQIYNSPVAQNDQLDYYEFLSAGTWTIYVCATKGTSQGIYTLLIDDVSVGTMDFYAGSGSDNNEMNVASIAVATSGIKKISLKVATKNASSSNYGLQGHNYIRGKRTA